MDVDGSGALLGVVTRREVLDRDRAGGTLVQRLVKRAPAVAFEDSSLREAADLMVSQGIGRLPVVSKAAPKKVVGILTRSDLLSAHARRLTENHPTHTRLNIPFVRIARVSRDPSLAPPSGS